MARLKRHPVFSLDVESYKSHPLHSGNRDWIESNCYVDLYIEVLHALGLTVEACLSFTLASDFEADQWTFFKQPLLDMKELYGLDVQELTLWRALEEQIVEQVNRGCLVAPEVDSYFLPDTAATDYRRAHVKSSIAVTQIDVEKKYLAYFHNTGYYELSGEDFDGLFSIGVTREAGYLPPYCELIKVNRVKSLPEDELVRISVAQARRHFAARPEENPFHVYSKRFETDLAWLINESLEAYHAYVFVTLRQCGANFDFAASYIDWLVQYRLVELEEAAAHFRLISQTAKMLILKLARLVRSKKPSDFSGSLEEMAHAWDEGMKILAQRLGT